MVLLMKTKIRTIIFFFLVLLLALVSTLVKPVTAAPLSAIQNPGTADLAAWWALDETSGERADSLGISNLADNSAVGYSSGLVANAADFETDNPQSLSITDNASLSTGDVDFTVGAWIKPESASDTDYATVLAKGRLSANTMEYAICIYNGQAYFLISDGTQYTSIISSDIILPDSWYFIAAWHDSAADQIGIQVNNSTPDVGIWNYGSWDSDLAFSIGSDSTPDNYFDGQIDEAFLYKRVLSEDERAWLHNEGLGRTYAELLLAATSTATPTINATAATPTATATVTAQATATPGLVTVIQTVIVTVPYIIIENENTNDIPASGDGEGSGENTTESFYATTPYPWQNVYGTGSTHCGGYSINVRVYVDYNEDKMMAPAEGVTDLQIFFLDQSYSRLGSAYTRDGQATFCISPTLYGRTIYIDIPYLQKFNSMQIPNEPKQDLEIWFAGDAPELPLFLP